MVPTSKTTPADSPRPAMADIDVFGLTHQGKVRATNADHFLIGSFHRALHVHASSLGEHLPSQETESRGFLLMVADGVGAFASARDGSAQAVASVVQHLLHTTEICSDMAITREATAVEHLRESVMQAHKALLEIAEERGLGPAATTLTLSATFWPRRFVIHVGDSRAYRLRGDEFKLLTHDQTMAEVMVESGAMSREEAEKSRLKHVLWSAVGSNEVAPEVSIDDAARRDVMLICSDGLTKHVSDDEIRVHLATTTGSEATCRALLDLALERGGTDNVTVVMSRIRPG